MTTENKVWCPHQDIAVNRSWNFCPICGAKRPEEPKALMLWETIDRNGVFFINRTHTNSIKKGFALDALNWFEVNLPYYIYENELLGPEHLWTKIRKWIFEEKEKCR